MFVKYHGQALAAMTGGHGEAQVSNMDEIVGEFPLAA